MEQRQHYTGLTEQEVIDNRSKYGENILTPPEKEPLWKLFLEKFKDPIIKILLVAATLSLVISIIHNEYAETIGIFCAILLATGVGFWFEMDANKKFEILNQVNDDTLLKVIRNGNVCEVSKRNIVVGDIVILETGEEVPADGELIEAFALEINESSLTGEPVIAKTTNPEDFDEEATYPSNHVLRGTTLVSGHCVYKVTAVGDATEFGKVAEKSTEISGNETPLSKQLQKLAKLISIVGTALAILTFCALVIKGIIAGELTLSLESAGKILQQFMVAVTLIVVAVPEGLPMSVTLSLALNMRRMLKTNNLVRKMHATETMGATTVICTDKTGTLTKNQMQVYQTNFPGLSGQKLTDDLTSSLIKEGISVNSTAFLDYSDPQKIKSLGNPTEAALLLWLHSNGVNYIEQRESAEIVEQLTFSTERKYMATIVNSSQLDKRILYIKGAPEIVLAKCTKIEIATGQEPVSGHVARIEQQLADFQNQAMRTLAFAYKVVEEPEAEENIEALAGSGLVFVGIAAISDPVREDVPDAVAKCQKAGIDIKIVTGDTYATAREIGRQTGIWMASDTDENIITGIDFEKLPDEEALKRVQKLKIMCRARPTDKQRLVQLLQKTGAVVAVTGDGTNDAPALNYADVGLSMGSGTSVAKEASDITLLDDSFNSIATAVMWGRSLYLNIQRFLLFQLTINVTALLIVFLGSLLGHELPLTVTQMLWVNMIIDTFAAAALASLPPSEKVMNSKPRKASDFILTKAIKRHILGTAGLFVVALLTILYYFTDANGNISANHLSQFFTLFVMLQFWNMFNAKAFESNGSAFKGLTKSTGFLIIMTIIPIGQILIVQFGGEVFRTVPLSFHEWISIIGGTSVILWLGEIIRLFKK